MDSMSKCKRKKSFIWYTHDICDADEMKSQNTNENMWLNIDDLRKESQRITTNRVILMPDALCYVQLVCASDNLK